MAVNSIRLSSNVTVPKGNFAFLMDLPDPNKDLYEKFFEAESISTTNRDLCYGIIRKALEVLAADMEIRYRADKELGVRSRDEIMLEVQNEVLSHTDANRNKTVKSLIVSALDREKEKRKTAQDKTERDRYYALTRTLSDKYNRLLKTRPDPPEEIQFYSPVKVFLSIFDFLSGSGAHVTYLDGKQILSVGEDECPAMLSLVHALLQLLYHRDGSFRPEMSPIGDFIPIGRNNAAKLHLIWNGLPEVYIREQDATTRYYLLKEIGDDSDPEAKRETKVLKRLWENQDDLPENIPFAQGEIGEGSYRRNVFLLPGKPVALDDDLQKKLSPMEKDEVAMGMIRSVDSLHRNHIPLPHRTLSRWTFYICQDSGRYRPVLCRFDTVKDLSANASRSMRDLVANRADDARTSDYIDPNLKEAYPDLLAADIYSLGRILIYLYTGRPFSDGSGFEPSRWAFIQKMISLDAEERPQIQEVLEHFSIRVKRAPVWAVYSSRNKKKRNQDAFYCSGCRETCCEEELLLSNQTKFPAILGVFDGLGGAEAGDEVARCAALTARNIGKLMLIREYRDLATPMRELAEQIEKEIVRYKETHGLEGSGTTMAAAYVSKDALAVVNVGDSRIYRFRGETLTQLTRDHRHPDIGTHRGELYQAIGFSGEDTVLEPYVQVSDFRSGDLLLLCTDGLEKLSPEAISQILRSSDTIEEKAMNLVYTAEETGEKDNITVILFTEETAV